MSDRCGGPAARPRRRTRSYRTRADRTGALTASTRVLPRKRAVIDSLRADPSRLRFAKDARELNVQLLLSETRLVAIVVLPRLTCTRTLPLQPSAFVTPLGSVSVPV